MNINFSTPILDIKGEPLKDGSKNVILSDVATNALLANYDDERALDGPTKAKRFKLALRVSEGGEIDLQSEDIAEIKRLIGKCYSPIVVGRAYDILDPPKSE